MEIIYFEKFPGKEEDGKNEEKEMCKNKKAL